MYNRSKGTKNDVSAASEPVSLVQSSSWIGFVLTLGHDFLNEMASYEVLGLSLLHADTPGGLPVQLFAG